MIKTLVSVCPKVYRYDYALKEREKYRSQIQNEKQKGSEITILFVNNAYAFEARQIKKLY